MMNRTRQLGMTLIELMVALALGVFLITGVINVFLANKDSAQVETSLARLQENGRIALDMLVSDLRDAYYIGCGSRGRFLNVMASNIEWNGMLGFENLAAGWSPALPTTPVNFSTLIPSDARVGSDVLYVSHGRRLNMETTADVNPSSGGIPVSASAECIGTGETVIMATCSHASLFRVTNAQACDGSATTFEFGAGGNDQTNLEIEYSAGTELFQTFEKFWYVRPTGRTRTGFDIPVFALYRRANNQEEEMVEGVEYMQILYGAKGNLNSTRYVPASDINLDLTNDDIVSVRVALLIQSFEPVLDASDTTEYQVLDESIGATDTTFNHNGDRTLRRVFQTTVLMKNPSI